MPEIRFRKLKIAWTLGCGLMLVLLIMLWGRSYTTWDRCYCTGFNHGWQFNSMLGQVVLVVSEPTEEPIAMFCASLPTKDRFQNDFDNYVLGFYVHYKQFYELGVPYWFLVVLTLGIASAARMKQFSLRILLIYMSLVALVLAVALYAMNRATATHTRLAKNHRSNKASAALSE